MLIGIGSRWKRKNGTTIPGYTGESYADKTVIVLEPSKPAEVRYQYECDGVRGHRTLEAFARDFEHVPAGHDLSNPYLAKPPFITCMSCGKMWDREYPEPPDCEPLFTGEPMQVLVDRNQGNHMAQLDFIVASPHYRRVAREFTKKQFMNKFEPGRNGLGAGIVGRWPW